MALIFNSLLQCTTQHRVLSIQHTFNILTLQTRGQDDGSNAVRFKRCNRNHRKCDSCQIPHCPCYWARLYQKEVSLWDFHFSSLTILLSPPLLNVYFMIDHCVLACLKSVYYFKTVDTVIKTCSVRTVCFNFIKNKILMFKSAKNANRNVFHHLLSTSVINSQHFFIFCQENNNFFAGKCKTQPKKWGIYFRGSLVMIVALIKDSFLKWEVIADTQNAKSSVRKMSSNEYSLWSSPDRLLRLQKVGELSWIWLIKEILFLTLTSITT